MKKPLVRLVAALSAAWTLGGAGPASAQLMSKWGHPVFTVGLTPYDTTDQGHGEYPGNAGFLPGYGYYPGPEPSRYPWLDGPGMPFDRRKLRVPEGAWLPPGTLAASREGSPAAGSALIIVNIPEEAELWFDDRPTSQSGSTRRFTTPPLPDGRSSYTLRVRWRMEDVELRRMEDVEVRPGSAVTVNFLTTDSWTGWRSAASSGTEPTP
jgi:uncharacterized protein (TIGR03000 family)